MSRATHQALTQRKSPSDITAGRALLYRFTKIMKIFREKTGDNGKSPYRPHCPQLMIK